MLQIQLQLQSRFFYSSLLGLERGIHKSLTSLLNQEEVYWAQRARLNWLTLGDNNTSYFHASATLRKQKNSLPN